MNNIITLHIKNHKIYLGKDSEYNTIEIVKTELKNKQYIKKIIARIDRINEQNIAKYNPAKEKKAVEYVNKTPQGTGFNRALIGIIEKNERIRKEMERIKQLLKE